MTDPHANMDAELESILDAVDHLGQAPGAVSAALDRAALLPEEGRRQLADEVEKRFVSQFNQLDYDDTRSLKQAAEELKSAREQNDLSHLSSFSSHARYIELPAALAKMADFISANKGVDTALAVKAFVGELAALPEEARALPENRLLAAAAAGDMITGLYIRNKDMLETIRFLGSIKEARDTVEAVSRLPEQDRIYIAENIEKTFAELSAFVGNRGGIANMDAICEQATTEGDGGPISALLSAFVVETRKGATSIFTRLFHEHTSKTTDMSPKEKYVEAACVAHEAEKTWYTNLAEKRKAAEQQAKEAEAAARAAQQISALKKTAPSKPSLKKPNPRK